MAKGIYGGFHRDATVEYTPLIPTMTSNTAPSGVASCATTATDTTSPAYYAFRGAVSTAASDCAQSSYGTDLPWYVGYQFVDAQTISRFDIYFAYPDNDYGQDSAGYICVSDDGSEWTQVATFSGLAPDTVHTITLDTPRTCKYFRVYLTAYNNTYNSGSCRVGMIQAYSAEETAAGIYNSKMRKVYVGVGRNLLPIPDASYTDEEYGVTFTASDGVLSVDGAAPSGTTLIYDLVGSTQPMFDAGTYTLRLGVQADLYYYPINEDGTNGTKVYMFINRNAVLTLDTRFSIDTIYCYYNSGNTGYPIYPMMLPGEYTDDTWPEFQPYRGGYHIARYITKAYIGDADGLARLCWPPFQYLYNSGNLCESVTGGYVEHDYSNYVVLTQNADHLLLESTGSNTSHTVAYFATANAVDIGGYSKLKVLYDAYANVTNDNVNTNLYIGLYANLDNPTDVWEHGDRLERLDLSVTGTNVSDSDLVGELDISALSGYAYLTVDMTSGYYNSGSVWYKVKAIWLEP